MGFGADIVSSNERDVGEILAQVQQHDLLKFGIIPELVGRLPVIACCRSRATTLCAYSPSPRTP